jgi:predicted transcriptional regulator YheO
VTEGLSPNTSSPEQQLPAGIPAEALPAVLEMLGRLAHALVATLGPHTEVVVHDLRHPERSIVAISGELTGRKVGAPAPDPELFPEALARFTGDDLGRSTTTQSGHELTSSTVWVRDETNRIIGGVCVNVDVSGLRAARDLIDRHLATAPAGGASAPKPLKTFAHDVRELISLAVQEAVDRTGKPRHRLSSTDRIDLVRALDQCGVLELRGSASSLAEELGVSRATVYAYLKKTRLEEATEDHSHVPRLSLVLAPGGVGPPPTVLTPGLAGGESSAAALNTQQ